MLPIDITYISLSSASFGLFSLSLVLVPLDSVFKRSRSN